MIDERKEPEVPESDGQTAFSDIDTVRAAIKTGLVVFHCPYEDCITLDLDAGVKIRPQRLDKRYKVNPADCLFTNSKSGAGKHVYIPLYTPQIDAGLGAPLINMAEAIAAGSDPTRERLSYERWYKRFPWHWKMFETSAEARRVEKWAKHHQVPVTVLTEKILMEGLAQYAAEQEKAEQRRRAAYGPAPYVEPVQTAGFGNVWDDDVPF